MGVVRREGQWRLHKRAEGVYEVTHKDRIELKIVTDDYRPTGVGDARDDMTVPVREVSSFNDAEALFEDMVAGRSAGGGLGTAQPMAGSSGLDLDLSQGEGDADWEDLPPGGVLLVGVIAGGLFLSQTGFDTSNPVFFLGVGLLGVGIVVSGLAYREYQQDGFGAALDYLVTTGDDDGSGATDADDPDRTPPTPETLKNELIFDRAGQQCEWCEEHTDNPEVHHIEPRAEGGPNEPENLIVLCPNHHRLADNGGLTRTKLKAKVSRQMADWSRAD
ncbi:HNH endonuclease [Halorientalis brevis]|uniref:HNH endonuclease n=1 Tax=Halorientalis brevis TaxID=1126241 RepID=A0ABD6CEA2_9EURY|nr:HNH endonuclease signature motif containing protein [Halorientalis brevis]